jgi:hypothetical protein
LHIKLLVESSFTILSESTPFRKLCRELLIAEQKVLKTELARWGGNCSDQIILSHADGEPDEAP